MMLYELCISFVEWLEFMVGVMIIDGVGLIFVGDICEVLYIDFLISSFDIDVGVMCEIFLGLLLVKVV